MLSHQEVKNILKQLCDIENSISSYQDEKSILDDKVKHLKNQKEDLRNSLMSFMNEENIKIFIDDDFGELSIRKSSDKYEIKNEDELIDVLKSHDRLDEFCDNTIKLNKRKLNSFLNELRSCDSLPTCIEIQVGSDSIVFKSKTFSVTGKNKKEDSPDSGDVDKFSLEEWDSI
jgi:hypothetical protein